LIVVSRLDVGGQLGVGLRAGPPEKRTSAFMSFSSLSSEICDNDRKFPFGFESALAERWVGSARRECFDWLIIRGQRHLEWMLDEYVDHYNRARLHRGLRLHSPNGPLHGVHATGVVRCRARLGGLITGLLVGQVATPFPLAQRSLN
jgi:hypothetical protein